MSIGFELLPAGFIFGPLAFIEDLSATAFQCFHPVQIALLGVGVELPGRFDERLEVLQAPLRLDRALGLVEQLGLRVGIGRELLVALRRLGVTRPEEHVLRGLEPLPQCVVDILGGAARGFPLRQQITERRGGRAPVRGARQRLWAL